MDARLSALADFLTPPPEIELVPDLLSLAEIPVVGFSMLLSLILSSKDSPYLLKSLTYLVAFSSLLFPLYGLKYSLG